MPSAKLNPYSLVNEISLTFSKSSGPGGQNVNKVNSRVELRFSIHASLVLKTSEKELIYKKLHNKINSEGDLILSSQQYRSQLKNKEKVIDKFLKLIEKALTPEKKRIPSSPTVSSSEKRLDSKKMLSRKKKSRQINMDDE